MIGITGINFKGTSNTHTTTSNMQTHPLSFGYPNDIFEFSGIKGYEKEAESAALYDAKIAQQKAKGLKNKAIDARDYLAKLYLYDDKKDVSISKMIKDKKLKAIKISLDDKNTGMVTVDEVSKNDQTRTYSFPYIEKKEPSHIFRGGAVNNMQDEISYTFSNDETTCTVERHTKDGKLIKREDFNFYKGDLVQYEVISKFPFSKKDYSLKQFRFDEGNLYEFEEFCFTSDDGHFKDNQLGHVRTIAFDV